ncbi:hypothetical protein A0256_12320 [Mucilaginibacter sp. PAMC 26640]|nr:hypothetical protein A0256_12320 [Mucilaginibacter sp. PAMC 26640]
MLVYLFIVKHVFENRFPVGSFLVYTMLLQFVHFFLFFYLTIILIRYQQHQAVIRAFKFYTATAILILIGYLVSIRHWSYFVSAGAGLIALYSVINLIVQVRKIGHPLLLRYYRILVIMIITTMIVKGFITVGLPYLYTFSLPNGLYSFAAVYSDLFSLLTPIAMLLIFHNIAKLIRNPAIVAQTEEEYL